MKTTTNTILPNDYTVKINKTKMVINSTRYDAKDKLKIKKAIKVLETVIKNLEEEVSKLRKKSPVN